MSLLSFTGNKKNILQGTLNSSFLIRLSHISLILLLFLFLSASSFLSLILHLFLILSSLSPPSFPPFLPLLPSLSLFLGPSPFRSTPSPISFSFLMSGPTEIEETWGVPPSLIPHVQAVIGDRIDNSTFMTQSTFPSSDDTVPSVPGLGIVRGGALIREFGTVEALLIHRDKVPLKYRELYLPFLMIQKSLSPFFPHHLPQNPCPRIQNRAKYPPHSPCRPDRGPPASLCIAKEDTR